MIHACLLLENDAFHRAKISKIGWRWELIRRIGTKAVRIRRTRESDDDSSQYSDLVPHFLQHQ
ncbi:MAG: hypothetical protein B7Z67_14545 [Acidiphilium sp. 21-60-14]|nr:MAG: hypothetical protein B7Z67_14545 [Acidiphilium sp. 21-60-14]